MSTDVRGVILSGVQLAR